jgi:hypothetical protein
MRCGLQGTGAWALSGFNAYKRLPRDEAGPKHWWETYPSVELAHGVS